MAESANLTYYQRKRDVILNRAKNYHENDQERLREQAKKRNKDIKKNYRKTRKPQYNSE